MPNDVTQVTIWANYLQSPDFIRQIGALSAILLLGFVLRHSLTRVINHWQERLLQTKLFTTIPPLKEFLPLVTHISYSLTVWLTGEAAIVVFNTFEWDVSFLQWAVPFLGLWFFYQLVGEFIAHRLPEAQATFWHQQIIHPIFLLLCSLQLFGLLDDLLSLGFRPTGEVIITFRSLLYGAVTIYVFIVLNNQLRRFLNSHFFPNAGLDEHLAQVATTITTALLLIIGTVSGLSIMGIDLTGLAVVAGGISVGIGFGLQAIISNFISGVILLFDQTIRTGDVIHINGQIGRVEELNLRTMEIITADNIELIVPNADMLSNTIVNYTHDTPHVRVHLDVGAHYNSDPHQVIEILKQATDEHPLVLSHPLPNVFFTNFGESSIDFQLLFWVNRPMQIPRISSDLRLRIWDLFAENGIEMPYPQRDVHLHTVPPQFMPPSPMSPPLSNTPEKE
ncbi:MAG TPA: mechanosensitive ion channel domain-containing protein [Anaerolineae bacterium]|nr:mechanosensitive ion channel domain-containing protein [Anaerolineae bacterium]